MTRTEVLQLVEAEDLGAYAEDLVARVRPGWRLDIDLDEYGIRPAASKIGGPPTLLIARSGLATLAASR